jgi:hypothetical protein
MSDGAPYPGPFHHPGMDEHRALEFFMATNDGTAIDSWHWLVESSTTSFYIKAMNRALQGAKVSIHGPDDRYPGLSHNRYDVIRTPDLKVDQRSADRAARGGGRWLTDPKHLPLVFEGQQINDNAALIVRFSARHDAFMAGAPAAGGSDWPKDKATGRGIVPVPAEGRVRHIDVFLSYGGEPYWPVEAGVRAAQAGVGFVRNSLGWCLSVVVLDRPDTDENDPTRGARGETPVDQCARGIATGVDESGFLWLCETLIPSIDESARQPLV